MDATIISLVDVPKIRIIFLSKQFSIVASNQN